jgi:hypothetical protein
MDAVQYTTLKLQPVVYVCVTAGQETFKLWFWATFS